MFPDKAAVFDLVIAPRFERILDERWPPAQGLSTRQEGRSARRGGAVAILLTVE